MCMLSTNLVRLRPRSLCCVGWMKGTPACHRKTGPGCRYVYSRGLQSRRTADGNYRAVSSKYSRSSQKYARAPTRFCTMAQISARPFGLRGCGFQMIFSLTVSGPPPSRTGVPSCLFMSSWTRRAIDAISSSRTMVSTDSSAKSVGDGARGRIPTTWLGALSMWIDDLQ